MSYISLNIVKEFLKIFSWYDGVISGICFAPNSNKWYYIQLSYFDADSGLRIYLLYQIRSLWAEDIFSNESYIIPDCLEKLWYVIESNAYIGLTKYSVMDINTFILNEEIEFRGYNLDIESIIETSRYINTIKEFL